MHAVCFNIVLDGSSKVANGIASLLLLLQVLRSQAPYFRFFGIVRVCIMKLEIGKSNTPGEFGRYTQEEQCQKKEMGGHFVYIYCLCEKVTWGRFYCDENRDSPERDMVNPSTDSYMWPIRGAP